jgi:CheY-like chemotaxis protein
MLIADDDPAIVRWLVERCAKLGFEIETATNGIQALILARRNQPDVLIVDVNMPEADGLSVCTRLLESSSTPFEVIVLTGSSNPKTIERCGSLGTFYARKGPDLWPIMAFALATIFPDMADSIRNLEKDSSTAETRTRPRVLLIDDDPDIATFLSSRLGKRGVDLLYASDAVQGYRVACKEGPSVIISDYFMPDGDAHYLLGRLRGTPVTEKIPVFVMSGRRLDEPTEQRLKRDICGGPGAAHIFMKSFDTTDLFDALQRVCAFETVE